MEYELTNLADGMPIILLARPRTPRMALAVAMRGGVSREAQAGTAKLAGRLLVKGTERRGADDAPILADRRCHEEHRDGRGLVGCHARELTDAVLGPAHTNRVTDAGEELVEVGALHEVGIGVAREDDAVRQHRREEGHRRGEQLLDAARRDVQHEERAPHLALARALVGEMDREAGRDPLRGVRDAGGVLLQVGRHPAPELGDVHLAQDAPRLRGALLAAAGEERERDEGVEEGSSGHGAAA